MNKYRTLILTMGLFCSVETGFAQSGRLDPSFGNSGIVKADLGALYKYDSKGRQVIINPDQSFYIIEENFISKRLPNGSIDISYGFDGYSTSAAIRSPYAALQADGKIVVAGYVFDSTFNMLGAIARINSNGAIDSSFGNNGIKVITFIPRGIALQRDGKILITGGDESGFVVARYNIDCSIDYTFNGIGQNITVFELKRAPDCKECVDSTEDRSGTANVIAIQQDGKIIVGGSAFTTSSPDNTSFAIARYNTNGTIDSTFDNDGKQTTKIRIDSSDQRIDFDDAGYSLALQNDGKIILAGYSQKQFVVVRYNNTGTLDSSFDYDGRQTINFMSDGEIGNSAAIQNDGKIVVAGYTLNRDSNGNDNYDFALTRLTNNGSLDNTFDGDGMLTTDFNSTNDYAASLAIQGDGKIIVVGYLYSLLESEKMVVVRYDTGGTPDKSFGTDGKIIASFEQGNTSFDAIAVQEDGKIIAAGQTFNGTNNSFAVARYYPNGTLDKSFGNNGRQITDFGNNAYATAVALQSNGKILVAGNLTSNFCIVRYNNDGNLDSSFNGNGKVIVSSGYDNYGNSIALQSDGKIVFTVTSFASNDYDSSSLKIFRLNINGSADNTFSQKGDPLTNFRATSIAIQNDGKILLGGSYSLNVSRGFAVARYNTDGSLDKNFSGDGKNVSFFDPNTCGVTSLAVQNDGKIIIGGYSEGYNGITPFVVARYKSDGNIDSAFGKDGFQFTNIGGILSFAYAVAIKNDGRIALAGGDGKGNFAILLHKSNGTLDSTFGNNGIKITNVGIGGIESSLIQGLTIRNNELYAVGYGEFPGTQGVVAKYLLADNKAPGVKILNPNNNTIFDAPATFTLTAYASDADGSIQYVQFYNNGTLLSTDSILPYDYTVVNAVAGNYSFVAKATDNNGLSTNSASVNVTVVNPTNKTPQVNLTAPANNATYSVGAAITLNATATDPDGTIANIKFYNGSVLLGTDNSAPYSFTINNASAGSYKIFAKAINDKGLTSSSATLSIFVGSSQTGKTPAVSLSAPANNASFAAPANITLNATASDQDGTVVAIQFYNGGTLLATDSTSPYSYTLKNAITGNYSFVAKVIDNKGLTNNSASVAVSVAAPVNKAPEVSINNPAADTFYHEPATIVLSVLASDSDGSIKNVKFYSGATLLKTDSIAPYTDTLVNVSAGNYSYIAKATDNSGLTSTSASIHVTVIGNKVPAITLRANDSVYNAPANISLAAAASDSDGMVSYVEFYNGSTLLGRDSTSPYSFTWTNVAAGNYLLTAKAVDNTGAAGTSTVVHILVKANGSLEAEDALLSGAIVASSSPGFNGAGYADYIHASGDFIEWTVNTPTTGAYTLKFRYANGSTNRPLKLEVNGVTINASLDFLPTGSWATWSLSSANANLVAGTNTIRLITIGLNGPNIDNVALTPVSNTTSLEAEEAGLNGAIVASSSAGFQGSGYADYTHASGDYIEWTVNTSNPGPYTLKFRYANGSTNRPLQLLVNGVVANASLDFLPTGSWSTWSVSSAIANLITGTNTIRLTTIGLNGPNVDNLSLVANTSTLEAEEAVLHGALIASGQPGFTGSGYADYTNTSGDYIEWTANVADAGTYSLKFRYANGSSNRPLQVQVNGAVVNTSLNFPATGGWINWAVSSASANLIAGINKIRLTTIGSNGPNVDNLTLSIPGSIQPAQSFVAGEKVLTRPDNILKAIISPNPVRGNAKLVLMASSGLPVHFDVADMSGRTYRLVHFVHKEANNYTFSVSSLPAGAYIISAKQGQLTAYAKLIVTK